MATDRTILRLGKRDEGRFVSSEEFAEAEFSEPWRYERDGGSLKVMAPAGEDHIEAGEPWRDALVVYKLANPGRIQRVVNEAWIRVNGGTDRIGDIGVYFVSDRPVPAIPDRVPEMVFEIVSPDRTARERDYVKKRAEYHGLGVLEYVIIDRFQRTVTVLSFTPKGYDERLLTIGETYESGLLPGFSVRLSDVFLKGCPLASTAEKYLKPEVIRQVARLDLRAKFIVEGFISGLHASPFQGFSVEFSEHRKYSAGDNISDIDWAVFAKTDRFYIKKYQAETNLTGYLVMDLSGSMGYTYRQDLTKFEYGVSLAAALGYLMIHQQDPVGLISFDQQVRQSLSPKSKRTQLGNILSLLSSLKPSGETEIAKSLHQVAGMIRHKSLIMIFSDLLGEPGPIYKSLHRLRHSGHDVILFHILDEAEALFPFHGMLELEDNETRERIEVDADAIKADYLEEVAAFRGGFRKECNGARIDYIPLHTGMPFDKALMSYLNSRQGPRLSRISQPTVRDPRG